MKQKKPKKTKEKTVKSNKNYTKYIKISIIVLIIVIIFTLGFITYKILFAGNENSRFIDIDKYKLAESEIKSAKDKLNELENIENIDIYIKSKIIRIVVKLKSDIEFEKIKEKSNEVLKSFTESNLSYYDVEFFIDSNDKDSQYPKIGYKYKTNSEFSW